MKMTRLILSLSLVVLIAVGTLTGCEDEVLTTDFGFKFEVTDDKGEVKTWDIGTNQTTVGAALRENGLIEEEFVTKVNGLTADYETDGAYWAFYIDGEYAVTGVYETKIKQDKVYAFVYTKD